MSEYKSNTPEFPLFRKYVNGRSWFEVRSEDLLIEYQQLGKRWMRYEVTADKMPDRVFIEDVINLQDGRWEAVSADAFSRFLITVENGGET